MARLNPGRAHGSIRVEGERSALASLVDDRSARTGRCFASKRATGDCSWSSPRTDHRATAGDEARAGGVVGKADVAYTAVLPGIGWGAYIERAVARSSAGLGGIIHRAAVNRTAGSCRIIVAYAAVMPEIGREACVERVATKSRFRLGGIIYKAAINRTAGTCRIIAAGVRDKRQEGRRDHDGDGMRRVVVQGSR